MGGSQANDFKLTQLDAGLGHVLQGCGTDQRHVEAVTMNGLCNRRLQNCNLVSGLIAKHMITPSYSKMEPNPSCSTVTSATYIVAMQALVVLSHVNTQ